MRAGCAAGKKDRGTSVGTSGREGRKGERVDPFRVALSQPSQAFSSATRDGKTNGTGGWRGALTKQLQGDQVLSTRKLRVLSYRGTQPPCPDCTSWITKPHRPNFFPDHARARNAFLSPNQRRRHRALFRSLRDAENDGAGGGDRSSAGSVVGRCPCHGTSRKWDGKRRYGTDDGPSQKVVVFLHLLSYVARNADVCLFLDEI